MRVDFIRDASMAFVCYIFYAIWTNNWARFEKEQMLKLVSFKHEKLLRVLLSGRSVHTLLNKGSKHHMGNESSSVVQLKPAI